MYQLDIYFNKGDYEDQGLDADHNWKAKATQLRTWNLSVISSQKLMSKH